MTDNGFDQFLADALRPPDRDEDQQFARQVIKRIGIEQQLRKQRSAIVQRFASDLIALLSVSAALVAVSRAPALREIGAEQISTLLATVLLGLGAWIWISSSAAQRFAAGRSI